MKRLIIAFFMLSCLNAMGQDNYTLIFLPQLEQSQWLNASNMPENKVSVGAPAIGGLSFYIYNSGFTYHDVFHNLGDTAQSVNMRNLFSKLKPMNYTTAGASVNIFSLNIARNHFSGGFSITDKAEAEFDYPAEFFKFLWYGNGPTLGQNVQIGNFGFHGTWYREFAFHLAYNYKKWTFGINPKILEGKTNIDTRSTSVMLRTDPNNFYAMTAKENVDVRMSGIEDSADKANGGNFSEPTKTVGYIFNTGNPGHAIDLAVKYEFNDRFNISAGVNNLGYIHWASDVHNYTAYDSYTFSGINLPNFFQGDSSSVSGETLKDSLKNLLRYKENYNAYTTTLPYDLFAMANYQLKHNWFGLEITARRFEQSFLYSGTASYQLKLGKHFTGALTYTVRSYAGFNFGGGLIFQFAHMQFYAVTDNWYAAITPLDSKNTNLNVGMNLVFGNRLRKDNYAGDHSAPADEAKPTPETQPKPEAPKQ